MIPSCWNQIKKPYPPVAGKNTKNHQLFERFGKVQMQRAKPYVKKWKPQNPLEDFIRDALLSDSFTNSIIFCEQIVILMTIQILLKKGFNVFPRGTKAHSSYTISRINLPFNNIKLLCIDGFLTNPRALDMLEVYFPKCLNFPSEIFFIINNRASQSVVFNTGQKMALRAFYFIRTLTQALTY